MLRPAQISQKELLINVMDLAVYVESTLCQYFKPYPAGWYRRHDEAPVMPLVDSKTGVALTYHTRKETSDNQTAPWDEAYDVVTDPNLAESNIYDQNGELIVRFKRPGAQYRRTLLDDDEAFYFITQPVIPIRGIELIKGYLQWQLDRNSEWVELRPHLVNYIKDSLNQKTVESQECLDYIREQLDLICQELRCTLDAFVGISTWEIVNIKRHAPYGLHFEKVGDWRVLEWTRLKKEGKI